MDEIAEMNEAKNDVESHIFQTRDKLEYDEVLIKVSTDEEKVRHSQHHHPCRSPM